MINKAEQAERLLKDEFFQYVVKLQQDGYISYILGSPEDDIDTRERALMKYRAIQEFVASIESMSKQKLIDKKRLKIF